MPAGDRTGPLGRGPLTGRRMGYCSGNEQAGNTIGAFGRGLARGFRGGQNGRGGFSRFRNFGFAQNADDSMENRKRALENELEFLKKQVSGLESEIEKLG
ncbi:MAG: DUF5320 domain-containing protein [Bacteroidales bacterium]